MQVGHTGSCVAYARIRAQPCNLFIISIYVPHSHRKSPPYANDTISQVEEVLTKVEVSVFRTDV